MILKNPKGLDGSITSRQTTPVERQGCIRTSVARRGWVQRWANSAPKPMDELNQYTRATVLAGETVQRLQREGCSADEAKRLVAAVINAEEFALMKGRHSFDLARFSERLRQLPD